jgi:hypothetical protein
MSYANRELMLGALAETAMSPAELAALTGESVVRIDNWLKTRRHDHKDVYVFDWRHIAGTNGGFALWRAGEGESKPYPSAEFQRLGDTQLEAKARAADLARQRASIPKRAARDPVVAALFGHYRRRTNNGASA